MCEVLYYLLSIYLCRLQHCYPVLRIKYNTLGKSITFALNALSERREVNSETYAMADCYRGERIWLAERNHRTTLRDWVALSKTIFHKEKA